MRLKLALAGMLVAACAPAWAAVSGSIHAVNTSGARADLTFTCSGQPGCAGRYSGTVQPTGCSNALPVSDAFRIDGLDLSRTGTQPVTVTFNGANIDDVRQPGGTCTRGPGATSDMVVPMTATWNGTAGSLAGSGTTPDGQITFSGSFTQRALNTEATVVVNGTWRETSGGFDETARFSCRGAPTCTGIFSTITQFGNCSNLINLSGNLVIDGLDLAVSGSLRGTITLSGLEDDVTRNADGSCTVTSFSTVTHSYTGSWDRARGAGNLGIQGDSNVTPVQFTASLEAPPPVFDRTVTSNITATTATATAQIQFRAQDVGREGRIFAFAYAPAARVRGPASSKAEGDCVIAQLDTTGRLVATSSSEMQSFFSGVLSSQGAAVSIMNNVSTPSVAGATFYVGYGTSAAAMLDEGVFRDAVVVPGSGVCPLLPMQTALWWNPRESGWGLNLNHQGNILFGTLFTYDAQRAPLWLVMSGGRMQADGRSFTGELYRTTGPAFNATPFTPITAANLTQVGTMSVAFADANVATLTYGVDGTEVTKSIERQVFGARASNCMPVSGSRASSTNYQDLWWNAAESGWGLNIAHQGDILFATLFTYDASGRGLWLVMSAGLKQADGSYLGELYRTSGPAFNAVPFTPIGASDLTAVGTMRLRFSDGERGELTYTYNGATVTKQITRQVFASPAFGCN